MAHTFRKYLSNRGSALFMVLSTMTALLICCMAMYFSVVSSRSTQYAIFNQQQAYQSATSINDALLGGLSDGSLSSFYSAIQGLSVGDTITTNSNGFATFDVAGAGIEDEDQLGAYTVTVTRLEDEMVGGALTATYDITITTSVNGVKEVYHSIFHMGGREPEPTPAPTQVFAATGYVPNDVYLDGGRFITDLFFDNEQTLIGAYPAMGLHIWGDVSSGGSLTVNGRIDGLNPSKAQTFAIRNRYVANFNMPVNFCSPGVAGERSLVMIGGDCYFNENNGFANADVYINGDLYIRGNPELNSSNYFVNGNIYIEARQTPWGSQGWWVNLSKVRCNGIVDTSKNTGGGVNGAIAGPWSDAVASQGFMTVSEMITKLDEKTATNVFYKWVINDNNPSKDAYVKELDESRPSTVVKRTLHFSMDYTNPIPTQVLKYSAAEKGCIIEDVTVDVGNTAFNCLTVIIDTGEDEDNVYTIRVKPNRDFTGPDGHPDGIKETFCWYPFDTDDSSKVLSILVKGKGSVVVDIPEGVTYQDVSFAKFMHYGWFVLGGGTENHQYGTTDEMTIFDARPIDHGNADLDFAQFIHTECVSGDGCSYTTTNAGACSCGETKKSVVCSIHGTVSEYCPTCNPDEAASDHDHHGECINHVGRKEIDNYLASRPALANRIGYASDGSRIYPTTNIFLVSCAESADIRLSVKSTNESIIQNGFFGYIYAPYMTFKACYANQGGTMVRLMGGLTVSDYILQDSMSMLACWPEKLPTDLMGEDCKKDQLDGIAAKSWKISLSHH